MKPWAPSDVLAHQGPGSPATPTLPPPHNKNLFPNLSSSRVVRDCGVYKCHRRSFASVPRMGWRGWRGGDNDPESPSQPLSGAWRFRFTYLRPNCRKTGPGGSHGAQAATMPRLHPTPYMETCSPRESVINRPKLSEAAGHSCQCLATEMLSVLQI